MSVSESRIKHQPKADKDYTDFKDFDFYYKVAPTIRRKIFRLYKGYLVFAKNNTTTPSQE